MAIRINHGLHLQIWGNQSSHALFNRRTYLFYAAFSLNSWVFSVCYNDSFYHKALTRSCIGCVNEAVRIHIRRRNSLVTLYSESGPLHPLTIPEDQWAASVQHQGTGSRSGVFASVKGTVWISTRTCLLVMGVKEHLEKHLTKKYANSGQRTTLR